MIVQVIVKDKISEKPLQTESNHLKIIYQDQKISIKNPTGIKANMYSDLSCPHQNLALKSEWIAWFIIQFKAQYQPSVKEGINDG